MLMPLFCFSQVKYPRKAVMDGDTVCILLIEQVRAANILFVEKEQCEELVDTLRVQIKSYKQLNAINENLAKTYEEEIMLRRKLDAEKDLIIAEQEKQKKINERMVKRLKFVNKILIGGAATVTIAVTTAYLILKDKT